MRDAIFGFVSSLSSLSFFKNTPRSERKKERKKEQLNNSGDVKLWRTTHTREKEKKRRKKEEKKVKKKTRTTKNRSHKIQITLKKRKEGRTEEKEDQKSDSSVDSFVFITLCFNTCALHQNLHKISLFLSL